MRAQLQLQAVRQLSSHRCIDMAQQLLEQQTADVVVLRHQVGLGQLADDLQSWGAVAAAELGLHRAATSPKDASGVKQLTSAFQASRDGF
jgi:hypothetical protein